MVSESAKRAVKKYTKENLVSIAFKFNKKTEKELIDFIRSKENQTDYVRKLILKDMKNGNKSNDWRIINHCKSAWKRAL